MPGIELERPAASDAKPIGRVRERRPVIQVDLHAPDRAVAARPRLADHLVVDGPGAGLLCRGSGRIHHRSRRAIAAVRGTVGRRLPHVVPAFEGHRLPVVTGTLPHATLPAHLEAATVGRRGRAVDVERDLDAVRGQAVIDGSARHPFIQLPPAGLEHDAVGYQGHRTLGTRRPAGVEGVVRH